MCLTADRRSRLGVKRGKLDCKRSDKLPSIDNTKIVVPKNAKPCWSKSNPHSKILLSLLSLILVSSLSEALSLISPTLGSHEATSETMSRPTFQALDVGSISGTPTGPMHDDDRVSVLSERSSMTGTLFQSRTGGLPLMESSNKSGMNMRGLHRCIYVHKHLGKLAQFREYYLEQRRLQIDSDLRPPSNLIEVYQSYLAQVTGFFLVEDNVLRMTDGLIHQQDVDGFWEMAIVMLKGVVDTAFEGLQSATAMLLVKDFLLLVCSGLSTSGYPAENLKEILSSNTGKFHALMTEHVCAQVQKHFVAVGWIGVLTGQSEYQR